MCDTHKKNLQEIEGFFMYEIVEKVYLCAAFINDSAFSTIL